MSSHLCFVTIFMANENGDKQRLTRDDLRQARWLKQTLKQFMICCFLVINTTHFTPSIPMLAQQTLLKESTKGLHRALHLYHI